MAVEVERGFCMRGYVAKMRGVDVAKCRPFDGEDLPPMDVRMFSWWADVATPAKQRAARKKKRSIVELFAVSPQITAVEGEMDGQDGLERIETGEGLEKELQGENCRVESKKKEKEKKRKEMKKVKMKMCVAQKEKKCKAEIPSSLSISQLVQEVRRKKMLKKSLKFSLNNSEPKRKKNKKKPPCILSEKENNLKSSPKSATALKQIKNCSVQSILKKDVKIKTSPLKKQVRFCEIDKMLGKRKSNSSPVTEESDLIHEKGSEIDKSTKDTINETLINEKSPLPKSVDLNQVIEISEDCIEICANELSSSCLINKSQISHSNSVEQNPIEIKFHTSNKDVISVSSSTGSNKSFSTETRLNTDCISNNVCFDEEIIGLPLNSQGELTLNPNFHPNPNSISNPNYKARFSSGGFLCPKPVTIMPNINSSTVNIKNNMNNVNRANLQMGPLYYKDNFGTEHYYAPFVPVRPGLGFANMPGFEAMEIQNFPSSEPTVRLMGKNVRLGKNNHDLNGELSTHNPLNGEIHLSNGYRTRPARNFNPNFNPISRFGQAAPAQQILLNSTHCKHSQSQSQHLSFASSAGRVETSLPQWILNPKSKTHKPAFPSYTNPSNPTNIHHPCLIYENNNNNNNINNNYYYNDPYHPLINRPYVRQDYNHPINQPKSQFNFIKPSDYINPHNKRPHLEPGLDPILSPTRPETHPFNPAPKAQTANTDPNQPIRSDQTGNTDSNQSKFRSDQTGNTDLNQSKFRSDQTGWTGPVKLSAGARHVFKPGPDTDLGNVKPIYCNVPLTCGPGSGQKSCSEVYRF